MIGYTRAHRSRFKHPLFKSQKFCRGYAWDWMVAQAAFKDHSIEIKGKVVQLARGQFSHSMRHMADKFGWSLGVVQRFIARLETERMIDTAMGSGQMIVTVCNYEEYQADAPNEETKNDTENDTAPIRGRYSTDTIKKEGIKKVNKVKKTPFVVFWDLWPHKVSKQDAERAWGKLSEVDRLTVVGLNGGGFNAWKSTAKPDTNPIHASAFLNKRRWEDVPYTDLNGGSKADMYRSMK